MDLLFKIVKVEGARDEVLATASNFVVAGAAFDTSVSLWQDSCIELRQGARVIRKANDQDGKDLNA
jgi:hypothetical protein